MNKPTKPEVKTKTITASLMYCHNFKEIMDVINDKFKDIPLEKIELNCEAGDYCMDEIYAENTTIIPVSEEALLEYNRKLQEYNEWLKLNPPLTKKQKERKKLEKRKLELSRELAEVDKELKK